MPAALDERGSWSNPESVDWFVNFARVMFENFGDRVKYWLTINEQNMLTLVGPMIGTMCIPEGTENVLKETYQQNHHMLVAQAKAMALCHEMLPEAKIGPAPNISLVYPASCKPADIMASQNFNAIRNWLYLDMAVYGKYNNLVWSYLEEHDATPTFAPGDAEALANGHPDFIGINYYSTATVEWTDELLANVQSDQQRNRGIDGVYKGFKNPNLLTTEFGWEIDPTGFRNTLREIYSRYRLPIIITENGLGAYDKLEDGKVHDPYRIEYLRRHIEQLQLAITDGVEMMGYCPWSAIDLISTHEGMVKRYGFIYVDREEFDVKNCDRYRKDSFYWYKKVIATNGQDLTD
jgi:6-phospho-beta-glucosidase